MGRQGRQRRCLAARGSCSWGWLRGVEPGGGIGSRLCPPTPGFHGRALRCHLKPARATVRPRVRPSNPSHRSVRHATLRVLGREQQVRTGNHPFSAVHARDRRVRSGGGCHPACGTSLHRLRVSSSGRPVARVVRNGKRAASFRRVARVRIVLVGIIGRVDCSRPAALTRLRDDNLAQGSCRS